MDYLVKHPDDRTTFQLIDSSAVIGTGINKGNFQYVGHYSECIDHKSDLMIDKQLHKLNAQYCTLNIDNNYFFEKLILKNTILYEYKHMIPTTIGICFPQSCNAHDLNTVLQSFSNNFDISLSIANCSVANNNTLKWHHILIIYCFVSIGILIMLGTIIDWQFGFSSNKWIQLLVAFSLYTNTRQLLTVEKQPLNTITCFNGLRVISLLIIILCHIIDTSHSYVMNINEVFRLHSSFMMQFITNVELWVDIFLLLSGFLCAYSVINDTNQTTISKYVGNMFRKIIHRYIRLTPSLLAMIGFSKLLEIMASGPLWFQYLDQSQSTSWWTNLIYLNNIIQNGQTDVYSCLGHTWYLAVDMQMFIVSNIFIILLAFNDIRKQYLGIAINIGLILVAWTAIAIKIIFYGYPPTDLKYMNTAPIFNETLFSTYCRLPPYCVGILMAYIYNKFGKINIKWQINILLWILCIGINVAIVFTPYFWYLGYSYNNFLSVLFGSTHRTVWSICWSYMLYACATGQGGIVNRLLSWPALVPLSRLSFHAYLVHYPLLLLITFSAQQPTYLDPLNLVITFLGFTMLSLFISYLTYSMFEMPIAKIEKLFNKNNQINKKAN